MGEMGWIPDDPSVARSKSYQAYLKKYPQYKVFVGLMTSPNLGIFPQGPLEKFVMDEIGKADEAVNRGAQSPAAAMALVQQHLNEERRRRQQLGEPVGNGPQ